MFSPISPKSAKSSKFLNSTGNSLPMLMLTGLLLPSDSSRELLATVAHGFQPKSLVGFQAQSLGSAVLGFQPKSPHRLQPNSLGAVACGFQPKSLIGYQPKCLGSAMQGCQPKFLIGFQPKSLIRDARVPAIVRDAQLLYCPREPLVYLWGVNHFKRTSTFNRVAIQAIIHIVCD